MDPNVATTTSKATALGSDAARHLLGQWVADGRYWLCVLPGDILAIDKVILHWIRTFPGDQEHPGQVLAMPQLVIIAVPKVRASVETITKMAAEGGIGMQAEGDFLLFTEEAFNLGSALRSFLLNTPLTPLAPTVQ